ncbi:MAG: thiosulfate oxidation carrier protein SoxY [Gammaproteobacteria bacterium]|nr:thiosulfate oxidation carrier protein SoxY [Gammaproteobacteria bacterium]MDH5801362.1 thiosulfate oxidation carrier protein SoxY [Gammaproteobacteria bacterium]
MATEKTDVYYILLGFIPETSSQIELKAPAIAENKAVVPINIKTQLPNPTRVSIIADNNTHPLVAVFDSSGFTSDSDSHLHISTRIKLERASTITVIVETSDGAYTASTHVKVTSSGGC